MRRSLHLILIIFAVMPALCRAQAYQNLALEGGGIRGIAYCGAFEVLEARGILNSIDQVAGTSVGAVAGVLLSVGYRPGEIRALLYELRVQTFNDGRWIFFGGQQRMRRQYGWYRGDALEHWLEAKIAAKTGRSHLDFEGLHKLRLSSPEHKDFFATATNLSKQRVEVFSWKSRPKMELAVAVRTSMSVPLYFRAMQLDSNGQKSASGDVYVDGGLVMNFPLTIFDSSGVNARTLGLKLERRAQLEQYKTGTDIAPYRISKLTDYVSALYNLTIETLNRRGDMNEERSRTIYISTLDMNPRVRKITTDQKNMLYQSGYSAAENFFRRKHDGNAQDK
jgi:NTE family protein